MDHFLNGYGLMKYVDDTCPSPPHTIMDASTSTTIANPAFTEWFQKDQLIISYITFAMNTDMLALFSDISTSLQVWRTLARHSAAQSIANAANLRFQLYSLSRGTNPCPHICKQQKLSVILSLLLVNLSPRMSL